MTASFARDEALPGFPRVLDHARMTGLLAQHISGEQRFESCRVERFRYRPGQRAIVQYELAVRDERGAARRIWASGTLWPGGKSRRLAKDLDPACAFFEPETGLLVQLYPFDRHMPEIRETIDALRLPDSGLLPPHETIADIVVVRFRPGIGATLRVSTNSGKTFYVKICRDGSPRARFDLLESLRGSQRSFKACRPVAFNESLKAVCLAAAPGQSLETLMLRDDADHRALGAQAAKAMTALHRCGARPTAKRGPDGFAKRVRKQAGFIKLGLPGIAEEINVLEADILSRLAPVELAPAHLDMKADHLFLNGSAATLIDLDSFAASDPVYDPAMLAARIDAMPHLTAILPEGARAFRDAMLDAWFATAPGDAASRFGVNYASASLKVALYFLQHLEPDYPVRVRECLDRARTALEQSCG